MNVELGREICGRLAASEAREWLCTNGIGGFASGTVAGLLTRRYHGLLVAALAPPLGRTLLVSKLDERVHYDGLSCALFTNRWADGSIDPPGHRNLERFVLDGTTPVWTWSCADALVEKRVWMEPGSNTTYVRYSVVRARATVTLEVAALVNYRDYHGTTHGGWSMNVQGVPGGIRVEAFAGASPFVILADRGDFSAEQDWYYGFDLGRERERGLPALEDHLRAGTLRASLELGQSLTVTLSAEPAYAPLPSSEEAWRRRERHETDIITAWQRAQPAARHASAAVRQLVLAADQFVVVRPVSEDSAGVTIMAGYHWFGDWGRDTMISLPGLALATGRPEVARRILTTFARFVDRGMLPNRFPDAGEAPEYNTADATLWYFEAIRAYHAATRDQDALKELFPTLESIIDFHRRGTRYGIAEDSADGLLRAGEAGVQLTWMDAKVGDWVVTPRIGKPVEINALWFNALSSMVIFAGALGRPVEPWKGLAERVGQSFARFWCEPAGYCYDVIDGPGGNDATLRPNQILAVSLPAAPLPVEQERKIVEVCARHLLTAHGLRSLAPSDSRYRGHYAGGVLERDGAYHQGTVWAWLLGPFVSAHLKVYSDPAAAEALLMPLLRHLSDYGLGSVGELFDGDAPFEPGGCIAQAWSVAEVLRAWHEVSAARVCAETGLSRLQRSKRS
jgi:predicted glycogen debranching enzyme